jgi:hypothetical protein
MAEIYVSTDVEADGPIPGPNPMLSFASAAFTADKTLVGTVEANRPHARWEREEGRKAVFVRLPRVASSFFPLPSCYRTSCRMKLPARRAVLQLAGGDCGTMTSHRQRLALDSVPGIVPSSDQRAYER